MFENSSLKHAQKERKKERNTKKRKERKKRKLPRSGSIFVWGRNEALDMETEGDGADHGSKKKKKKKQELSKME